MKLKGILLTAASCVLTAAVAVGGTLAYLTSEQSDVNVMTTGSVAIEQLELQRADGVAYNAGESGMGNGVKEGALVPFVQNQKIYPAVPTGNGAYTAEQTDLFYWGDYVYSGTAGNGLWNDNKLANVMDKMVFVKNTGKSDAYVRTIIALECPEGMEFSEGSDKEFMVNVNGSKTAYTWDEIGYITVDGVRYIVKEATYLKVLNPGNTSHPSLLQVVMTHNATNEDMELLGDAYDIRVLSQAVQADGFKDAKTALDAAFGDVTGANAKEWLFKTAVVDSKETLDKAFNDDDVANTYELKSDAIVVDTPIYSSVDATAPVTVDGNGKTVTGVISDANEFQWDGTVPEMSTIFSSKNGEKVTVNDITFTGTMSAIMLGHYQNATYNNYNTELNNVNVIGAEVVSFSAGISPAVCVYGTAAINNCNIYGTKLSKLDTDPMWPVYDVAVTNYSDTTINNSKIGSLYMWNQAKVTVNAGTEIDEIIILGNMNNNNINNWLNINAGATVNAIDLTKITDVNRVKINIKNGATIGAFVDNGVEYATLDAWKAAQ